MVRNKGRGSGILRTPDVLRRMMEVGCEAMGPGKFSVKTRLGVTRTDELLKLIPMINEFPLLLEKGDRRLTGPTMPPQGLYLNRVWYEGSVGEMFLN